MRVFVGNDVVDLFDPEARGKADDLRFISRIMADDERRRFEGQTSDRALWSHWSAKEASYKLIVKRFGVSALAPELLVSSDRALERGTVNWRDCEISVRWEQGDGHVHCLATDAIDPAHGPTVSWAVTEQGESSAGLDSLTPREASSAMGPGSAPGRVLAKNLLASMSGLDRAQLEIVRDEQAGSRGPPRFHHRGSLIPDCDLSLSHHGRFVAATVACASAAHQLSGGR